MKKQIYNQNNSKKTIKGVPFLMIIKKADYHLHTYYLYSSKYQLNITVIFQKLNLKFQGAVQ